MSKPLTSAQRTKRKEDRKKAMGLKKTYIWVIEADIKKVRAYAKLLTDAHLEKLRQKGELEAGLPGHDNDCSLPIEER